MEGKTNSEWIIDKAIDDVSKSSLAYVFEGKDKVLLWQFFVWLILGALLIFLWQKGWVSGGLVFWVIFFTFGVPFARAGNAEQKIWKQFYMQFAQANGLSFQEQGDLAGFSGQLFQKGHHKKISYLVSGNWNNYPLKVFIYSYKEFGRTKKSRRESTFSSTVLQIKLPSKLPRILLISKQHGFFGVDFPLGDLKEVNAESSFKQAFTLYTQSGLEVEALQIFSPSFMDKMITNWPDFDLEFNDSNIIIFYKFAIGKKDQLSQMYELMKYILSKVEPTINRMSK